MAKLSLLYLLIFIAGCKSKTPGPGSSVETRGKDTIGKSKPIPAGNPDAGKVVIYDTIVFKEFMNGKLLREKYATARPEAKFYKQFIIPEKIKDTIIVDKEDVQYEIRYLGKIKSLDNKTTWQVITNFRILKKMLSPKGKSDLAFLSEAQDKIIIYSLPMPENLPVYINNNNLFFEYDGKLVAVSVEAGLPPLLCLPGIGCN